MTEEARRRWEDEQPEQPHVWRTLGYRRVRRYTRSQAGQTQTARGT